MAGWTDFFTVAKELGQGVAAYKVEQMKTKAQIISQSQEAKRIENQRFEAEAAAKEKILNAATNFQREDTIYQVGMAMAVGIGAALIGAALAQLLKAMKGRA